MIDPNDVFPPRSLPGADAERWGRDVEDRVRDLEAEIIRLGQIVQAQNRDYASQLEQQARTIRALPFQMSDSTRATGMGLTGGWSTYASLTFTVPLGKSRASVLAVGGGAYIDATTGGLTTSYGRCVISGNVGGESPAAKDAGASQVNNVINATHAINMPVNGGDNISILFQAYGLNGSAYPARPSNYSQIAAVASFS